ncbi:MAG TPA: type 1 glutamine amidotransferase domain-containing protein [Lacisediminihabitans sp.]|uniref:type 1 glutamine amidotransferase domain-containing protein n=1 Tax=Lacisediminihabitans sp. TaxID=2787631 RepID=UPI002ED98762
MATADISGKKIAFLLTDGVEQIELTSPWQAVKEAGGTPVLVSPKGDTVQGFNHVDKGDVFEVDRSVTDTDATEFDALVLPGGVINADALRVDEDSVRFVREFFATRKPVAAICHAPWILIEAGVVDGRRLTSYRTLRTDLRNAGAIWSDEEVVTDGGFVTSRQPDDLPAFNAKLVEEIREGLHARQHA